MRTTDATRDAGPRRPGLSRSEADRGGDISATGDLSPRLAQLERRPSQSPLAGATQPELVERARHGDRRALDRLFEECRLTVISAVSQQEKWLKILDCHISQDLYQEGWLAVMRAIQSYDARRSRCRFKTYAEYRIRKYVRIAAMTLSRPESVSAYWIEERSARADGSQSLVSNTDSSHQPDARCEPEDILESPPALYAVGAGQYSEGDEGLSYTASPGYEYLASGTGFEECDEPQGPDFETRLAPIREIGQRPRPYSLESATAYTNTEELHSDADVYLKDLIADEDEPDPADGTEIEATAADGDLIQAEVLHSAVGELEEDERVVVVARYGLGTEPQRTVKELANHFSLSEAALKDRLSRAISKLSMTLAVQMFEKNLANDLYNSTYDHDRPLSA